MKNKNEKCGKGFSALHSENKALTFEDIAIFIRYTIIILREFHPRKLTGRMS